MPDRPNIIYIMTDQHRLSAVGAYGPTVCETPNIDRLAAEGMLFENAYCAFPVCSPARGTIMTGRFPHGHGITANIHEVGCSVHELEDRPSLLPRRLQAAGYSTGYTGKWHLGTNSTSAFGGSNKPSMPADMGFEGQGFPGHGGSGRGYPEYRAWMQRNGYAPKQYAPRKTARPGAARGGETLEIPAEHTVPGFLIHCTIEMIEQFQQRDAPWFIDLNFWGPHNPYEATTEYVEKYKDIEIPKWPNYEWPSRETPGPHQVKIHWDQETLSWSDWAETIRYYYARASMIDGQIGRLCAYLEQAGLLENTVLLFSADHGETLGSHGGLLDKGWHHFEETSRIPMLVRMPDATGAGKRSDKFVSQCDVYPTVLDIAGAEWDRDAVHGTSFMPLVRGEHVPWRDCVVTEFLGLGNFATTMKMIRHGNIKYGFNAVAEDELYDLAKDPHEMRNLVKDPDYRDTLEQMRERLLAWMAETQDPARRMVLWRFGRAPTRG